MANTYKYILILFVLCLLSPSCIKKNIYVIDNTITSKDSSDNTVDSICKVSLFASVNPNYTKQGFTLLPAKRYVTVYIFNHGGPYQMTKNFITDEPGMLTPINGEIELVTGKYDFYIFSISNAYLYPPTMENNLASNLVNGYDYLYCTLLEKNILATTTLNITLNHAASQIIFDIVSSDNSIIIDSVANAQITPPSNTGLTWNMFTGVITPSRALASSLLDLIVSDQMCHNIVLPLVSKDSLNLGFEIWLNNKTYYRDYNVTVPLPNDKLLPGRSYRYEVAFNKDSIYMSNVNINDWIIVDETGNPLYPEID